MVRLYKNEFNEILSNLDFTENPCSFEKYPTPPQPSPKTKKQPFSYVFINPPLRLIKPGPKKNRYYDGPLSLAPVQVLLRDYFVVQAIVVGLSMFRLLKYLAFNPLFGGTCVAVCCRVLQWIAACCSGLQCVAVCCGMLLCNALGSNSSSQAFGLRSADW